MTDIEFEYADYCVSELRDSFPSPSSVDWRNKKRLNLDERLDNRQQAEILAILEADNWIERYQQSRMFRLQKSKIEILKEYSSYSNYRKSSDKENQLLKSSFNDKSQLETEVLKLQKESLEYLTTIRDKEEIIRNLEIRLKRIELIKQYKWFIGFILTACTILGAFLDRILQMIWP